jgi:hypothetical protein
MVLPKEKAKEKYLRAIRDLGGADAYYDCGAKYAEGGVKRVAECMKGLKKKVKEDAWAEKWAAAYEW